MTSLTDLKLNDPVQIDQKQSTSNSPLSGVVAFLGPVEFSDGDDWVGIRLTGTSVGKGKNDGTVNDKKYFDVSGSAGDGGGLFVRAGAGTIHKVTLTKLEALRLKRELQSTGASSSRSVSSASSRIKRQQSLSTVGSEEDVDDNSSVSSARSTITASSGRSTRLEEIRNRRLQIQQKQRNSKNKVGVVSSSASTSSNANANSNAAGIMSPPPRSIGGIKTKTSSSTPSMSRTPASSRRNLKVSTSTGPSPGARSVTTGSATSDTTPRSSAKKALNLTPKARGSAVKKTPISSRTPVTGTSTSSVSSSRVKSDASTPTSASTSKTKSTRATSSVVKPKRSPKTPLKAITRTSTSTATAKADAEEIENLQIKIKTLQETIQTQNLKLRNQNESMESMTEQLHMKDHDQMDIRTKVSSMRVELEEKESEISELRKQLMSLEQEQEQEREKEAATKVEIEEGKSTDDTDTKSQMAELRVTVEILSREKLALDETLTSTQRELSTLATDHENQQRHYESTLDSLQTELTESRAKNNVIKTELSQTNSKKNLREKNDVEHYKTQAKLQAEIQSWQRQVSELQKTARDTDHLLENLTLDKEALEEQKEELEDLLEEQKIDAESAGMEMEELRLDLESAREQLEGLQAGNELSAAGATSSAGGEGNNISNNDDVAQALSIQNARLREAIVRLREQTSLEKIEFTRQLRAAEKNSTLVLSLKDQVEKLSKADIIQKEEIEELKDIVDQGSAFEEMVEDLSERVLQVEDHNIGLQLTIRDLEEGGELSAEMEEAQAEEIKILMMELQNRETVVLNLEHAIKMQRRRELDFQRTVGNYRSNIETLQKEKQSLLEEMGGRDGMQEDAILASQKALAQAAQSVADATLARKKEAEASFHLIDARVKSHLAERLEDFLPQGVASSEISAVKGELLLSKIAMKASLSLSSVVDIFEKSLNDAKQTLNDIGPTINTVEIPDVLPLSNNLMQEIGTMIHQTKFSQLAIELSARCMNLLAVGQWPSLMSSEASMEMGILVAHVVPDLDTSISEQLLLLKKEGSLSPHQSNLNILTQSLDTTFATLKDAVNDNGSPVIPVGWSPPFLQALKSMSLSKFNCYGTAATLSVIIGDSTDKMQNGAYMLNDVMIKCERLCCEFSTVFGSLCEVEITDDGTVHEITNIAKDIHNFTAKLFSAVEGLCTSQEIQSKNVSQFGSDITAAENSMSKLTAFLRSQQIDGIGDKKAPLLSPEAIDPWASVVEAARKAQSVSADADDLNFIERGTSLEEQLSLAVENDTKLSIADAKIKSLEKNLGTRSKEIAMQNSRLEELEALLTNLPESTDPKSPQKSSPPTAEVNEMKEEIRVLNEAMEIVQGQVEEYEREIRTLKDQKSKSSRLPGSARKGATTLETDFSLASLGIGSPQKQRQESVRSRLSLESALFRPALRSALSDASMWKSKVISDKLIELPPLSKSSIDRNADLVTMNRQLSLACASVRLAKASVGVVKLGDKSVPRLLLAKERQKTAMAIQRLESLSDLTRFSISARVA